MKKTSVSSINSNGTSCFHNQRKHSTISAKPFQNSGAGDAPQSADEIIQAQGFFIENLQQQIFFMENEIGYLRSHVEQANKIKPTIHSEAESMIKKLTENQKEIQNIKIELKRKQTTIDILKSEKDRLVKKMEEHEVLASQQKFGYLEEIVELKKLKDEYHEKCVELKRVLEESTLNKDSVQADCDSLRIQLEELKKELEEDKKLIECIQESKQQLQKSLTEVTMQLELKTVMDQQEAITLMKNEIQDLYEKLTRTQSSFEREKALKIQLTNENDNLIKRHATIEAELAEAKAKLGEVRNIQSKLEEFHLQTVMDASKAKSSVETMKAQICNLKHRLKVEKDRSLQLASQLADEQRFKIREEQKVMHMEKRLDQKEEKAKAREKENSELLKDNASLKDQILILKNQIKNRDSEIETLKQQVLNMQVSVEEFMQSSRAASQLEGQRWKQLTQLAKGIQALSKDVINED